MTDPTILKNLHEARAFLATVPTEQTDLTYFRDECGTHFCAVGWLTQAPQFKHLMELVKCEIGAHNGHYWIVTQPGTKPVWDHETGYDLTWLDKIFGKDAFDRLFAERGLGEFDRMHPNAEPMDDWDEDDDDNDDDDEPISIGSGVTDKQLILWRFDQQLKEYP